MRISIEVIPRNLESLDEQLAECRQFESVDTINVPDLLRFPLRSLHAGLHARQAYEQTIPHLRAIDINPHGPSKAVSLIRDHGLKEVLVVTGDAPADMSRPVYDVTSLQLIRRLRQEFPDLVIYSALDPYRSGPSQELAYAHAKLAAGCNGFFTQPYFDLRFMELYREQLAGLPVFWGITSVTGKRTRQYWQNRNHAVFPAGFDLSLEWNRNFAASALAWARQHDQNLYFMPIRSSITEFLGGLL